MSLSRDSKPPNHALQRTRPSRSDCKCGLSRCQITDLGSLGYRSTLHHMKKNLILMVLLGVLVSSCDRKSPSAENPGERPALGVDSCLQTPRAASIRFASPDDAFKTLLNSTNRSERYSATLYLKSQRADETIQDYGKLLNQLSHPPARLYVYESMGFFGGSPCAQVCEFPARMHMSKNLRELSARWACKRIAIVPWHPFSGIS